jgi:hypothetical protein
MAAIGEAERASDTKDNSQATPVFFLPRMGSEHGNFDLLLLLFPNIKIVETASEWLEIKEEDISQTRDARHTRHTPHTPHTQDSLTVLSGFFQDVRYFPKQPTFFPKLPSNVSQQDAWAIHFRFGDYTFLKHYHVNLARYYFYTITNKIPKHSTLILFSDSPDRLKPIQKELENLEYKVEIFNNPDTLETMKAFASCVKGSVCSNSTFSWWCAWFAWNAQEANDQTQTQTQTQTQSHYKAHYNAHYKAHFPDQWIVGQPSPRIFEHPFTQTIKLDEISASPELLSFSHS